MNEVSNNLKETIDKAIDEAVLMFYPVFLIHNWRYFDSTEPPTRARLKSQFSELYSSVEKEVQKNPSEGYSSSSGRVSVTYSPGTDDKYAKYEFRLSTGPTVWWENNEAILG